MGCQLLTDPRVLPKVLPARPTSRLEARGPDDQLSEIRSSCRVLATQANRNREHLVGQCVVVYSSRKAANGQRQHRIGEVAYESPQDRQNAQSRNSSAGNSGASECASENAQEICSRTATIMSDFLEPLSSSVPELCWTASCGRQGSLRRSG